MVDAELRIFAWPLPRPSFCTNVDPSSNRDACEYVRADLADTWAAERDALSWQLHNSQKDMQRVEWERDALRAQLDAVKQDDALTVAYMIGAHDARKAVSVEDAARVLLDAANAGRDLFDVDGPNDIEGLAVKWSGNRGDAVIQLQIAEEFMREALRALAGEENP